MITENTIESCIEDLASGSEDWIEQLATDQPVLAGFLSAEDLQAFTPAETEYLYYLAVVCWLAFQKTYGDLDEIDEQAMALKEEQNWNRVDSLRPSGLKTLVDRWLPDYEEPEILYYLEDALALDPEDPDHPVTKFGQIPLFVSLLTLVDALIQVRRRSVL
jgi:hypothetical protein